MMITDLVGETRRGRRSRGSGGRCSGATRRRRRRGARDELSSFLWGKDFPMGICFAPSALSERRWPSAAQAIPFRLTVPSRSERAFLTKRAPGPGRRRSRLGRLPGRLFVLLLAAHALETQAQSQSQSAASQSTDLYSPANARDPRRKTRMIAPSFVSRQTPRLAVRIARVETSNSQYSLLFSIF